MKQKLILLRDMIDAKSLRDRIVLFALAAGVIVCVVYSILLSPLFDQQTQLRAQIKQQNNNIVGIDAEITAVVVASQRDPNRAERQRLQTLQNETAALRASMQNTQANLVSPERMVPLLDNLLRGNPRLRLLSMKSLPVVPVRGEPAPGAAPVAVDAIYRHGVELTVSGNYLDMLDYMRALEAVPTRLYWSSAALQVEQYPVSRLTLTLYTLSLDKKWMTL